MYCYKCGKQIKEGNICADCAAKNEYTAQGQENNYEPVGQTIVVDKHGNTILDPDNRMFGFGKALAATIVGFIGFICGYVWLVMSLFGMPGAAILILAIILAPMAVLPILFGIQSIKTFIARKENCAKPIPTLILGIVGVSLGGLAAFFDLLLLFSAWAMG